MHRDLILGLTMLHDEVREALILFGPLCINWEKLSLLLKEYPVDSLLSFHPAKKTKGTRDRRGSRYN